MAPTKGAPGARRWLPALLLLLAVGVPVTAMVFRLGPMVTGPTKFLLRAAVVVLPLMAVALVWRRLHPPSHRGRTRGDFDR